MQAPPETPQAESAPSKKCGWCCKTLGIDCFKTNPKTNELYSKCEPCRVKHARTCNSSANRALVKRKYKSTEAGKAVAKRYRAGESGKARAKRYRAGEAGKAAEKRFNSSDAGRVSKRTYKSSETGKAAEKRYRDGDAGKATAKRFAKKRAKRRRMSKAMRLDNAIMCASSGLIRGRRDTSPTFIQRTGFASETAFLAAVKATLQEGMTLGNHHSGAWQLDHKIPREAYDFDNPEDVKRCWSAANVQAVTPAANMEKSWKLLDEHIASAGVGCFPTAWDGKFPDEDMKRAHVQKMMRIKASEAAAGQFDSEDGDESDSDGSEDDLDELDEFGELVSEHDSDDELEDGPLDDVPQSLNPAAGCSSDPLPA